MYIQIRFTNNSPFRQVKNKVSISQWFEQVKRVHGMAMKIVVPENNIILKIKTIKC